VNYCGIDLAGVSSYAFVTDEKGNKLWSGPIATEKVAFEHLVKKFSGGGLSIAIEAGNQTAWVHEELVKLGAEVTVVNPTKVKLIAESRRKTDKIDAKILCELLRLNALPHGQAPRPQCFANTYLTHFMGEFHRRALSPYISIGA
jgi:transposase